MSRNDRVEALRVISGGQTGVDRAALDVALKLGLPCGGTCPKGRRADDGRIPDRYPLLESDATAYPARTERNVVDADATLVLTSGTPTGGTALTIDLAKRHDRPCYVIDVDRPDADTLVQAWLRDHHVRTLNVAGPRESGSHGIHARASRLLERLLSTGPAHGCGRAPGPRP